jgi:DNA-binding MarR family transcriptional regulator
MTEPQRHPTTELDETVHQRVRLGILAVLAEAAECSFGAVRDALELTDGNLSRHVQVLHQAGLIEQRKGYENSRPRTWLRITKDGRKALHTELAALERLVTRLRKQ